MQTQERQAETPVEWWLRLICLSGYGVLNWSVWGSSIQLKSSVSDMWTQFSRLLLVGGCESGDDSGSKALCCGITAWRSLSGSPHYKQVTSYEDDINPVSWLHTHKHTHTDALVFKHNLTGSYLLSTRIRSEATSGSQASNSFQDKEMKR